MIQKTEGANSCPLLTLVIEERVERGIMAYKTKINYAHRSNYGSRRSVSKIRYIIWHYTASDGATDEASGNYFRKNITKTSAHYFVDDDSVTVSVPDDYTAYSVGGSRYSDYKKTGGAKFYKIATNANSISIELCDVVRNGKYDVTEKTLENAILLTRVLMKKYNIPIDRVIRHFDVTGKKCPAYYVDNTKWEAVKRRIAGTTLPAGPASGSCIYGGLDYAPVFETKYYSDRYSDLKAAFGNDRAQLFNHFIAHGMREGRQAIDSFNVRAYRARYPDLQNAFGDNLPAYYLHYIQLGRNEKRIAI